MFQRLILIFVVIGAMISTAVAQTSLKSSYKCELVVSKGAVYRDDYAPRCKYQTQKAMTFLWAGKERSSMEFSNVRAMSKQELSYAPYWLKNIKKLDTSSMMQDKGIVKLILSSAANATSGYAMSSTRNGEPITMLVYITGDGAQYGMSFPSHLPRHEPYDLFMTK